MRIDVKKLFLGNKVAKFAKNGAIAALLLMGGAALNETFSNDDVSALDAPMAIVEETTPVATPTADMVAVEAPKASTVKTVEKTETAKTTTKNAVANVQTVTPVLSAPKQAATPVKNPIANVALISQPAKPITSVIVTKPVAVVTEKPATIIAEKPTTGITSVVGVAKAEVLPTTTKVSFVKLDGEKVEVDFAGSEDEFSGLFVERDGKWVALSKKDSLKVNPFQHWNWTRNGLIEKAIQMELHGFAKEVAWNEYYKFEAQREPHHYQLVNGYTRPNKLYFSKLVLSSIAAAREAKAKSDDFGAGEWTRNAREHLASYHAAPGTEVKMNLEFLEIQDAKKPEVIYAYTTSVSETPVTEKPVVEAPVTEKPVVEAPVTEKPVVETPVTETAPVEEPIATLPAVEVSALTEDAEINMSEDLVL